MWEFAFIWQHSSISEMLLINHNEFVFYNVVVTIFIFANMIRFIKNMWNSLYTYFLLCSSQYLHHYCYKNCTINASDTQFVLILWFIVWFHPTVIIEQIFKIFNILIIALCRIVGLKEHIYKNNLDHYIDCKLLAVCYSNELIH